MERWHGPANGYPRHPAGDDADQEQEYEDPRQLDAERGCDGRCEKHRNAARRADEVDKVETLNGLQDGAQAEREDDEWKREGEEKERRSGFAAECGRHVKHHFDDERHDTREGDPCEHSDRGLTRHRKGRNTAQRHVVALRCVLGHELRRRAPQPEVQDAEIAQHGPHESQEPKALLPEGTHDDRDCRNADGER